MVTTPIASALWAKLAKAPPEWFKTKQGKALVEKSLTLVRDKEGEKAATDLQNLISLAEVAG